MNIEDIKFKLLKPSERAKMLREILEMTEKILELTASLYTDIEIYKLYNETKKVLDFYKTQKIC